MVVITTGKNKICIEAENIRDSYTIGRISQNIDCKIKYESFGHTKKEKTLTLEIENKVLLYFLANKKQRPK